VQSAEGFKRIGEVNHGFDLSGFQMFFQPLRGGTVRLRIRVQTACTFLTFFPSAAGPPFQTFMPSAVPAGDAQSSAVPGQESGRPLLEIDPVLQDLLSAYYWMGYQTAR
jgi:hypothetical protein